MYIKNTIGRAKQRKKQDGHIVPLSVASSWISIRFFKIKKLPDVCHKSNKSWIKQTSYAYSNKLGKKKYKRFGNLVYCIDSSTGGSVSFLVKHSTRLST